MVPCSTHVRHTAHTTRGQTAAAQQPLSTYGQTMAPNWYRMSGKMFLRKVLKSTMDACGTMTQSSKNGRKRRLPDLPGLKLAIQMASGCSGECPQRGIDKKCPDNPIAHVYLSMPLYHNPARGYLPASCLVRCRGSRYVAV